MLAFFLVLKTFEIWSHNSGDDFIRRASAEQLLQRWAGVQQSANHQGDEKGRPAGFMEDLKPKDRIAALFSPIVVRTDVLCGRALRPSSASDELF